MQLCMCVYTYVCAYVCVYQYMSPIGSPILWGICTKLVTFICHPLVKILLWFYPVILSRFPVLLPYYKIKFLKKVNVFSHICTQFDMNILAHPANTTVRF